MLNICLCTTWYTHIIGDFEAAFVVLGHGVVDHGHDKYIEDDAEGDEQLKDQVRYNSAE